MSLLACIVIAALVTALLVKSNRTKPAVFAGLLTAGLVFAAFPALGPAITHGTAEFAGQLGAATDRGADVHTETGQEVRR